MTSYCKNQLENDFITTDMKSAGIHFLNHQSFILTQPFSFLDQQTGPILPFMALPLCVKLNGLKMIFETGVSIKCF